ncbi:hypothetical protein AJ85_16525 [Alkalihalobacillus alcalophilus ATCC 27647 = CGMCC 1.3604]|uniref:NERD domain-containing protein n=2 Tax=Alkalihalobacillus alcalophilus ATCC 27647 = CGMCC 1.3604 TaxID=1218173 RepID=A0A4V3X8Z1_ALKAL|nr:NERD domain-containing protein [Alkalihalobacillus alcalophilus]MED1560940.1 NERD domain-containing protein [Alkalihalobacillus alcalophilus]THG92172.1 hypothetical protein AJ85_16525 [Alkalihalobacillus alcalophilus ATCC 27647 = CGMCC 1.3604]
MAHLVKLSDYVSRYQIDLNHYSSQFTRMKKERWYYIKAEWEQAQNRLEEIEPDEAPQQKLLNKWLQHPIWNSIKSWKIKEAPFLEKDDFRSLDDSLQKKRQEYLNSVFESQITWASSSLGERSNLDEGFFQDKWLKQFCIDIPENYFLFYEPIFYLKNAEIEFEILLISPTEILCLTILNGEDLSVFEASSERFWIEYIHKKRKKRLSPLLELTRMEKIVQQIIKQKNLHTEIRKVVLSPNSIIDNKLKGSKVEFVDKRNFKLWKEKLIKHPSPLKKSQFQITSTLLSYCQTKVMEDGEEVEEITETEK